ncbi:MAG: hypothetical protein LBB39_01855, partial [Mycoplasmataceae bacterium]|nr:hypothetical protein [Mycoplasmataceae bacterium]
MTKRKQISDTVPPNARLSSFDDDDLEISEEDFSEEGGASFQRASKLKHDKSGGANTTEDFVRFFSSAETATATAKKGGAFTKIQSLPYPTSPFFAGNPHRPIRSIVIQIPSTKGIVIPSSVGIKSKRECSFTFNVKPVPPKDPLYSSGDGSLTAINDLTMCEIGCNLVKECGNKFEIDVSSEETRKIVIENLFSYSVEIIHNCETVPSPIICACSCLLNEHQMHKFLPTRKNIGVKSTRVKDDSKYIEFSKIFYRSFRQLTKVGFAGLITKILYVGKLFSLPLGSMIGFTIEQERKFYDGTISAVDLGSLCSICNFPRILLLGFSKVKNIIDVFYSIKQCSKSIRHGMNSDNNISVWGISNPIQLEIFSHSKLPKGIQLEQSSDIKIDVSSKALQYWKELMDYISKTKGNPYTKQLYLQNLFCKKDSGWNDKRILDTDFTKAIIALLKMSGVTAEMELFDIQEREKEIEAGRERKKSVQKSKKEKEGESDSDFDIEADIEMESPSSHLESSNDFDQLDLPSSPPFTVLNPHPKFLVRKINQKFCLNEQVITQTIDDLMSYSLHVILLRTVYDSFNWIDIFKSESIDSKDDTMACRIMLKRVFSFNLQIVHLCIKDGGDSKKSSCLCECKFSPPE